jgi:hypothetical protein
MSTPWARLVLTFALVAVACAEPAPRLARGATHAREHPGRLHEFHASSLALAAGPNGELFLAWSRRDADAASVWVARASGAPVRVDPPERAAAASHEAPGLAVGPRGEVHVLWTARPPEAAGASVLLLSTSRDAGASFGPPLALSEPGQRSHDFASLAAAPDGALVAAWLEIGGPVASARSARVEPETGRVAERATLETSACVCCRTAVAFGPAGAGILWRGEREGSVRDMYWARSADGGRRFGAPEPVHADGWRLDACPHRGGSLAFDASGRALAAWYTEGTRARPSLLLASARPAAAFEAPRELRESAEALPDRPALAVAASGAGLVAFESATSVRRAIVARAFTPGAEALGPGLVLSSALQASGPAAAALPGGGFAVAWHEEAFPVLRSVVVELASGPP